MKESDWKIFKRIKEKAIEEFCSRALVEFSEVINDDQEHVHNRFLLLSRLVKKQDKAMFLLFDSHSRSKAPLQLLAIRGKGLADETLLKQLSPEFYEQTDPTKHGW